MNKQKGFTIIELIVVIAIIAVLSGIVMINVAGYINKSRDAAIQADLKTIVTDSTAAISDNSLTSTTISGSTAWTQITTYQPTASLRIQSVDTTNKKFCACVQSLSTTTNYYCVDTTGQLKTTTTNCTATTATCDDSSSPACP